MSHNGSSTIKKYSQKYRNSKTITHKSQHVTIQKTAHKRPGEKGMKERAFGDTHSSHIGISITDIENVQDNLDSLIPQTMESSPSASKQSKLGPNDMEELDGDGDTALSKFDTDDAPEGEGIYTAKHNLKKAILSEWLARDAGAILHTIPVTSIEPVREHITRKQPQRLLCSYNWHKDSSKKTLFVPGSPPKWKPPPPSPRGTKPVPYILYKDQKSMNTDYNNVYEENQPYRTVFHALSVMNPNEQFTDVDVLTDRKLLLMLLSFISGSSPTSVWRFDLHATSNTLFMTRKNIKNWDLAGDIGYGQSFEKGFTQPVPGLEDAAHHYRVIKYPIGSLNVAVRIEVDAYDDGLSDEDCSTSSVTDVLKDAEVKTQTSTLKQPSSPYILPINILKKGTTIPASQLLEIKTRNFKQMFDLGPNFWAQMWFGRLKHLSLGRYRKSTRAIRCVRREDVSQRLNNWEERHQVNLQKLVALLKRLKTIVTAQPGPYRSVVLTREEADGPLIVRVLNNNARRGVVGAHYHAKHWVYEERDPRQVYWRRVELRKDGRTSERKGGHAHGTARRPDQKRSPEHVGSQQKRNRGFKHIVSLGGRDRFHKATTQSPPLTRQYSTYTCGRRIDWQIASHSKAFTAPYGQQTDKPGKWWPARVWPRAIMCLPLKKSMLRLGTTTIPWCSG